MLTSSHAAIRPGISFEQALEAGLADYIAEDGRSVTGGTAPAMRPVRDSCNSDVLEMQHRGDVFSVRVFRFPREKPTRCLSSGRPGPSVDASGGSRTARFLLGEAMDRAETPD